MKGRRIPVSDPRVDPSLLVVEAGDYYGPVKGFSGGVPAVFFRAPINDGLRHVTSPPHKFFENEDGTITIRESIGCRARKGDGDAWHGFLTNGAWELKP